MFKIAGFGHPRMGTGYTYHVLKSFGFDVGHEEKRIGGEIAWQLAAELDKKESYWTEEPIKKILIARNPWAALPAIIKDNEHEGSYNLRRNNIIRYFDYDIDIGSIMERAIDSLYFWYTLCFLNDPDIIFRVESRNDYLNLQSYLGVTQVIPHECYNNSRIDSEARSHLLIHELKKISDVHEERFSSICKRLGY